MQEIKSIEPWNQLQFIYEPTKEAQNLNLLVLFHGFGDNPENFIQFGRKLNLQNTSLLAIRGIVPIPFFPEGSGWFHQLDPSTLENLPINHPQRVKSLVASRNILRDFLKERVFDKWSPKHVILLGFSQGGTMALDLSTFGDCPCPCISISGTFMPELLEKNPTDLFKEYNCKQNTEAICLVTHGSKDATITSKIAKDRFNKMGKFFKPKDVDFFLADKAHTMPKEALEARRLHTFFSKHLKRWTQLDELSSQGKIVEIK